MLISDWMNTKYYPSVADNGFRPTLPTIQGG